jgi:hypothetical protein
MLVPGFDYRGRRQITFGREMIKAALLASMLTYYCAARWDVDWLAVYAMLIWVGIAVAWVARSLGAANARRLPEGPRWQRSVAILFVVSLILTVRYDEYPHAKYLKVGPAAFVVEGSACGNHRHFKSVIGIIWSKVTG